MSDTSIYKVLNDIQKNIEVKKSKRNSFGNFNYWDIEDIFKGINSCEYADGCVFLFDTEPLCVEGWRYIKATVTMFFGGESISKSAYAREPETKPKMDNAQVTGSSSTYAKKYAICNLLALQEAEDPDNMDNNKEQKNTSQKKIKYKENKKSAPTSFSKEKIDDVISYYCSKISESETKEALSSVYEEIKSDNVIKSLGKNHDQVVALGHFYKNKESSFK